MSDHLITQAHQYSAPDPGDVRQYGGHEVICDERTRRYRVFAVSGASETMVCETRSWPVVLCKVFGILPTTVGGKADLEAYNARQYAELKVWVDPDTNEQRTVVSGTIHGHWTVILVLKDGERVQLGEEGRVIRRFYMARAVPKPEPNPKRAQQAKRARNPMSAGFEESALPADPVRIGAFEDGQGLLF